MNSVKSLLQKATRTLQSISDSPALDAELLLAHVMGKSRTFLFTYPEYNLSDEEHAHFLDLLKERLLGKPMAYIIGRKAFWDMDLTVSEATLIPRADTELLVETSLTLLQDEPTPLILELGTGSGAIALALAKERPDAQLIATDVSVDALAIAKQNAREHQITNIQFFTSDWFNHLPPMQATLIISNPPYISSPTCLHLDANVAKFEPALALYSKLDGYQALFHIIRHSKAYLRQYGYLILEHGIDQHAALNAFCIEQDYQNVQHHQDLQGIARAISCQWNNSGCSEQ